MITVLVFPLLLLLGRRLCSEQLCTKEGEEKTRQKKRSVATRALQLKSASAKTGRHTRTREKKSELKGTSVDRKM
jgi:hypothetical protein